VQTQIVQLLVLLTNANKQFHSFTITLAVLHLALLEIKYSWIRCKLIQCMEDVKVDSFTSILQQAPQLGRVMQMVSWENQSSLHYQASRDSITNVMVVLLELA